MKTVYIKFINIDTSKPTIEVKIVDGAVWMTINEIADLFGVYTPTISKHLKVMFKDGLLREPDVAKECRYTRNEKEEYIRIYYNLEVIIFLSFRIQTLYTKAFREWVLNAFQEYSKEKKPHDVLVMFNTSTRESSLKTLN
ncbi:ArsR family transcriptional regulator [Dysgonomonas sp. Marseille-Q5470]|uniref:ArsR family transcriptional regulator n=1 Tax=Dysgonomonas sp. Marseille-Q5470 TaxID=3039494 RepID=UPI0024BC0E99|nr:ArsR family transcriptional regulator [Dysgonomonas sp. Marseille-Q5470]